MNEIPEVTPEFLHGARVRSIQALLHEAQLGSEDTIRRYAHTLYAEAVEIAGGVDGIIAIKRRRDAICAQLQAATDPAEKKALRKALVQPYIEAAEAWIAKEDAK